MKAYERVEVEFYTFLTSAIDESKWSNLVSSCPRGAARSVLRGGGLVNIGVGLDTMEKKTTFCSAGNGTIPLSSILSYCHYPELSWALSNVMRTCTLQSTSIKSAAEASSSFHRVLKRGFGVLSRVVLINNTDSKY
jgi:hypothetical protein